jgi:hypothetical protein
MQWEKQKALIHIKDFEKFVWINEYIKQRTGKKFYISRYISIFTFSLHILRWVVSHSLFSKTVI